MIRITWIFVFPNNSQIENPVIELCTLLRFLPKFEFNFICRKKVYRKISESPTQKPESVAKMGITLQIIERFFILQVNLLCKRQSHSSKLGHNSEKNLNSSQDTF